jgi:small GTP-binding protein
MFERTFKIILLGDYAVGKTSILNRFLQNEYNPEYIPTISTNILEKKFRFQNYLIRLMLWDTTGERELNEMRREFCANTHVCLIVYDICRLSSFKNIEEWYRILLDSINYKPTIWVVGNKIDLNNSRVVKKEEVKKKAEELTFNYIEVSAKTGENIRILFMSILKDLLKARLNEVKRKLEVKV